MDVGERIKKRRLELNLTLDDVAEALGVAKSTILRYETKDINNMGIDKIETLSKVLKCSPAYLMGWDDEKTTIDDKTDITTIAAHKEGDEWTEEELETIEMVKEMLRQKRKKKFEE